MIPHSHQGSGDNFSPIINYSTEDQVNDQGQRNTLLRKKSIKLTLDVSGDNVK